MKMEIKRIRPEAFLIGIFIGTIINICIKNGTLEFAVGFCLGSITFYGFCKITKLI